MRKLVLSFLILLATDSVFAQSITVTQNASGGASTSGNNDFTGNNSFLDTKFTIKNTSDTTKAFQFLASGITAGQTRIITIPNFDATMATLAGTESLSNKTLPSFELGSAATDTTITRSAAGRLAVEGIDAVLLTTAQEVTNKTFPSFELGSAAIDTTITRAAAGDMAVEGVSVLTTSNTKTITNKSVGLGSGSGTSTLSGSVICKAVPNQATTGTTEEVLATCTIPANTLNTNGDKIEVEITAFTAANGNNKQLRVRLGGLSGLLVYDSAAVASNNQFWASLFSPVKLIRISSTTLTTWGGLTRTIKTATGTIGTQMYWLTEALTTADFTVSNDLVITGTTASASGDLTLESYMVRVLK